MMSIRTVLCPVDFSAGTVRQVDLAAELCQAFGAQLVLHHNLVELAIGSGVGWMWAVDHSDFEGTAQEKLQELRARLPGEMPTELRLSHGPVAEAVMSVARAVDADLVVLSTRGALAEAGTSITERVIERATLPVLAIHDAVHEHRTPKFGAAATERQTLLVPIDLTPSSQPATDVAFDLARRFRFDVHLLHVMPAGGLSANGKVEDDARGRMLELIPPEFANHAQAHVERGVPSRVITRVADTIAAACIVMGEHAPTPARHWFRPDTSQGVLHPAPCPIWYVPGDLSRTAAAAHDGEQRHERGAEPPAATPRLVDDLRDTLFHFWPTSQLYGVVDSVDAAESTLADLLAAGVRKDRLQTWYGAAGKMSLDPTGENHSRTARLWRSLEKAMPERELLDRYAAEIESGHVCIGVRCGTGEGRDHITRILQSHGGHLISYFTVGSVERLSQ